MMTLVMTLTMMMMAPAMQRMMIAAALTAFTTSATWVLLMPLVLVACACVDMLLGVMSPDTLHLGGGHDGPDDEADLHRDVDGDVDQRRHQQPRQLCGEH